jgi:hypothetical protein
MYNNKLEKFEDFAQLMQRDLSFTQVQILLIRYRNDGDFKALEELICASLWSTTVLAITVCENNGTTPTIDHVAEAINAFRLAADNCSIEEDFIEHAQKAIVNALDKKHNTEKQDFSGYAVHIRERTLSYIKLGKRKLQFGYQKNKFENKDQKVEERQLRIGENFYLPIYAGYKKIYEYELESLEYTKDEMDTLLNKNFERYCEEVEESGSKILEKNFEIRHEEKGAKGLATLTLLESAGIRRKIVDFQ